MKYFNYELVAAANDWIEQADADRKRAERRFRWTVSRYQSELDSLKPRISAAAWKFFRHGHRETGLHDGNLLAFSIGDGLAYETAGLFPFKINRARVSAEIVLLNYEQSYRYDIKLKGLVSCRVSFMSDPHAQNSRQKWGDIFTYELVSNSPEHLQLGLLFASGSVIEVEFQRMVFRRSRIQRQYRVGEMYAP